MNNHEGAQQIQNYKQSLLTVKVNKIRCGRTPLKGLTGNLYALKRSGCDRCHVDQPGPFDHERNPQPAAHLIDTYIKRHSIPFQQ